MNLTDLFVNDTPDNGEASFEGASEGQIDSPFSRLFGAAERTARIVRDFQDPVKSNARAATPPNVVKSNDQSRLLLWIGIGVGVLALVFFVSKRGK